MNNYIVASVVLVLLALVSTGCKSDSCRQMRACCDAVAEVEGMGEACGKLTKNVTKPETCLSVVQTVSYMYEDRGMELPDACQPKK